MKTHLADSSVPLTEGQDQIAICGAEVKQAAFVWQSESPSFTAMIQELNSVRMCQKCVRNSDKVTLRYAYLVTEKANLRRGGEVEA